MTYTGRFAPSPTGPLHIGSLISALASYLDARSQHGLWHVRIDDIDPPREVTGAADTILQQLERHGLDWDGSIIYQSQRLENYHATLEQLRERGLTYPCQCSRAQLQANQQTSDGSYSGHCLKHPPPLDAEVAVRVQISESQGWLDRVQGEQQFTPAEMSGDFVLLRKDKLISYQLAAAVDDCSDQITDVVRGADLLDSTPRQLALMHLLGTTVPRYAHVPIATDDNGVKLSKQSGSAPIDENSPSQNIFIALNFLGQNPPRNLHGESTQSVLNWGVENWNLSRVPQLISQPVSAFE